MKAGQAILSPVLLIAVLGFAYHEAGAQEVPTQAAPTHAVPPEGIGLTRPGRPGGAITVTDQDLEGLARKLTEFGTQLSETEKLMMDWLLQRAASAPPDDPSRTEIQGLLFTPPVVAAGAIGDRPSGGEAEAPAADSPAFTGAEETTEISPAPKAALGRALGMALRFPASEAERTTAPRAP